MDCLVSLFDCVRVCVVLIGKFGAKPAGDRCHDFALEETKKGCQCVPFGEVVLGDEVAGNREKLPIEGEVAAYVRDPESSLLADESVELVDAPAMHHVGSGIEGENSIAIVLVVNRQVAVFCESLPRARDCGRDVLCQSFLALSFVSDGMFLDEDLEVLEIAANAFVVCVVPLRHASFGA